jgi:hypothetical protein
MELGSYFLFLQEQIKDIIICGLQTPRRAAYLQPAAAVSIFAGDRVRRGDEHPVAGPSDATTFQRKPS